LVIGDVAGHGLKAASVMGQLRTAVRAYALEGQPAEEVVEHAGKLLLRTAPEDLATLVYAELDPGDRLIHIVSAGHPPPLIITPTDARYLEPPVSPPIGMVGGRAYQRLTVQLEPGATLVLYTDGLIDHRALPIDDGMRMLLDAAHSAQGLPAEAVIR